ncbi:class I SAM-dependent methyltransferase [Cesiribacter sp. SM1]|uniref:class I SAM-dependent methyltransferase n=1 Tax=Cesiribacter sp. SM1 TaxID=2861196 RepID=UPI001CD626FB|nr:class I SAM-dependent methyltransferase [Cesiribacter sp. SM1]
MSKQTESFYNRFSIFYPLIDLFLRPQKQLLLNKINQLPYGQLLDVGVGNGAHLSQYKTHKITGIDTSLKMLEIARKRKGSNVVLLKMNGEALSFQEESFDYVVLSHVLAVVDNPEKLLEEACRVLKPSGRLYILNHFTPDNWLKWVDRSFESFSALFHFKSVFYTNSLSKTEKLTLLHEVNAGLFSYFKILIYEKKL